MLTFLFENKNHVKKNGGCKFCSLLQSYFRFPIPKKKKRKKIKISKDMKSEIIQNNHCI